MFLKKTLNLAAFLSAIIAILLQYGGNTQAFIILKPLTTLFILIIPITDGNKQFKNYLIYTVLALLFCLMGDIFLLDDNQFIWGLASFLLAHILFTLSFVSIGRFKLYLLPLVLLFLFGLSYYIFLFQNLGDLAVPVLVYMVFIVIMSWQGVSLYIRRKEAAYLLIAIAVLLFMFSDSIIAWNKFKEPFKLSGAIILSTYWLSIALLANASTLIKDEKSNTPLA